MPLARDSSGKRDRSVMIQQLPDPEGTAPSGYPKATWTDLYTEPIFMSQIELGGRESFDAHQQSAPYDTRWQSPYMPDLDPEIVDVPKLRRLVVRNRIHEIVDAKMIGRYNQIELLTRSGPMLT